MPWSGAAGRSTILTRRPLCNPMPTQSIDAFRVDWHAAVDNTFPVGSPARTGECCMPSIASPRLPPLAAPWAHRRIRDRRHPSRWHGARPVNDCCGVFRCKPLIL